MENRSQNFEPDNLDLQILGVLMEDATIHILKLRRN